MREKQTKYKAVLRVRIDFHHDERLPKSLQPGSSYHFKEGSNFSVSYNDIVDEATHIVNNDLKAEIQKYTNMFVGEIEVQAVYEGSIEIIFSVVLGVLEFAGGLKDLYDTVHLIKEISSRHIKKRLDDRFGKHFDVDTYVLAPEKDYWRFERYGVMPEQECVCKSVIKRDVFFYYLLVANVVLLVIVAVLVYGAVKTVYF